ncbi:hypothetical protein CLF_101360, partial [Clonorchis sinensis]
MHPRYLLKSSVYHGHSNVEATNSKSCIAPSVWFRVTKTADQISARCKCVTKSTPNHPFTSAIECTRHPGPLNISAYGIENIVDDNQMLFLPSAYHPLNHKDASRTHSCREKSVLPHESLHKTDRNSRIRTFWVFFVVLGKQPVEHLTVQSRPLISSVINVWHVMVFCFSLRYPYDRYTRGQSGSTEQLRRITLRAEGKSFCNSNDYISTCSLQLTVVDGNSRKMVPRKRMTQLRIFGLVQRLTQTSAVELQNGLSDWSSIRADNKRLTDSKTCRMFMRDAESDSVRLPRSCRDLSDGTTITQLIPELQLYVNFFIRPKLNPKSSKSFLEIMDGPFPLEPGRFYTYTFSNVMPART